VPQPKTKQLELSTVDRERLEALIRDDWSLDSADLNDRQTKLRRWYRLWRNVTEVNPIPDQDRSNFSIPMILWVILQSLAKDLDVLLGEESEIIVNPIGKTDVDRVPKVKKWINWRIKHSLKLFPKLYRYLLQKKIFGNSIGFIPWKTKSRTVRVFEQQERQVFEDSIDPVTNLPIQIPRKVTEQVEVEKEVIDFDGPDLVIENLEDWVVPVNAKSIEDTDHFIRRLQPFYDELLDWEDEGKLSDRLFDKEAKEFLKNKAETSSGVTKIQNTAATETVTVEKKSAEGLPQDAQGREQRLIIYNWFGRFRFSTNAEMGETEERSEEIVAFYSPDLRKLLGVSRLVDIFPDGRRPFIKSDGILDVDSFWSRGLVEILEPIQYEMDAFHRLAVSAGEGAIGPVIFGTPAAGQSLTARKLEPYTFVPVMDPNSIKAVNLGDINLQPYVLLMQELKSFTENLTALTDPQLGRQSDRPNAPRTFGQQALLQAESNVRLLLDIRLEREALRELIRRIWELDKRYLPPETFFRVTEEDPGDVLTKEDMQGSFDFDIGPVTAISNRAQKTQELMQSFALVAPLGMPQITVALLKKVLEKMGQPDVAALLPDLGQLAPPKTPDEENARIMQGEDVDPHPLDNHQQHIAKHSDFRARMEIVVGTVMQGENEIELTMASQNPGLLGRIDSHIAEHQAAMKQKEGLSLVQAQLGAQGGAGGQGGQAAQIAPGNLDPAQGALQQAFGGQAPNESAQSQIASLVNTGGTNIL
jgi:hypothetical protein